MLSLFCDFSSAAKLSTFNFQRSNFSCESRQHNHHNTGSTHHTMVIDKKRKRSEGHAKRPKASGAAPKRQKSNVGKKVTSVDALSWKSVDVPEMFDDAEGFYGLE